MVPDRAGPGGRGRDRDRPGAVGVVEFVGRSYAVGARVGAGLDWAFRPGDRRENVVGVGERRAGSLFSGQPRFLIWPLGNRLVSGQPRIFNLTFGTSAVAGAT